jgi:glycosyltransferase involved in cell wall biosynthesis
LGLKDLRVTGVDEAPEGVTALGWVSEEEKWNLLQTAGCLIVPSDYEGQPMVILEALAAGCPVVASTNVPDLPECVKSIPLDDVEGWKEAISHPIRSGLEEAVAKHQIGVVTKQWGEIYDNIIDSKTSTE